MVVSWGTGRKDYSQQVHRIVQTVTSEEQARLYFTATGTIASGSSGAITVKTVSAGQQSIIYAIRFSVVANVLIRADLVDVDYIADQKYGYGSIEMIIPTGYIVTAERTVYIYVYNYGPTEITYRLSVHGFDRTVPIAILEV